MLCSDLFVLTQICNKNGSEKSSQCQTGAAKHRESLVISYRGWIVSLFSPTQAYFSHAIYCPVCFHGSLKNGGKWVKKQIKKAHQTLDKEIMISKLIKVFKQTLVCACNQTWNV